FVLLGLMFVALLLAVFTWRIHRPTLAGLSLLAALALLYGAWMTTDTIGSSGDSGSSAPTEIAIPPP
ncbi:MAG TPA: hypothetical protein PK691_12990, partial [Thermomicrobiales bacterium]|nr:hypothetical protein [Thermomicrobiales bacterium]